MKKITTLSLVVASLLFVGCDEKKETPTEANTTVKSTSSSNLAEAKKEIKEAVDASSKVISEQASAAKGYIKKKADSIDIEAVKAKASEGLDSAKKSISDIAESTKNAIEKKALEIKNSTESTTSDSTAKEETTH